MGRQEDEELSSTQRTRQLPFKESLELLPPPPNSER
jgi:hypothetical protein